MEKNIKMNLETARELYKELRRGKTADGFILNLIESTFTKEELEGDEGYTWEKAFDGNGWFWTGSSELVNSVNLNKIKYNKNVFKTEAQAKSALAFAQLSHIVAKYNEGKALEKYLFTIENVNGKLTAWSYASVIPNLYFHTEEDAKTSLRVNRELWEQYHML